MTDPKLTRKLKVFYVVDGYSAWIDPTVSELLKRLIVAGADGATDLDNWPGLQEQIQRLELGYRLQFVVVNENFYGKRSTRYRLITPLTIVDELPD